MILKFLLAVLSAAVIWSGVQNLRTGAGTMQGTAVFFNRLWRQRDLPASMARFIGALKVALGVLGLWRVFFA